MIPAGINHLGQPEFIFQIPCKVKRIFLGAPDVNDKGEAIVRQVDAYVLIPRLDITETTLFLNEHGEDLQYKDEIEFVVTIHHPVSKQARIALCRPNANYPENFHFFVMSTYIKDDLYHLIDREIIIETMKEETEKEFTV